MNLIATGNTAEVFDMGNGKVCKLFKSGYEKVAVNREITNTKIMNKTSICTPIFYEQIEIDGRDGIVYSKIEGSTLLEEAENCKSPEAITNLLNEMAEIQQQLHKFESTECISYKEFLSYFGYDKIQELKDGNTICHGDFHPGNIIRTKDNTLALIDFMNVCHGPKEYDIARTFVLLTEYLPDPQLKAFVGNTYLNSMEIDYSQVEPYIEAIEFCRKREML